MSKLIGTNPNQVPSNADLGTAAFMDKKEFLLSKGSEMSAIDAVISKTAVDVFIYDTAKDSDGGAWRKRTQDTSWYNEKLNTPIRGSRQEFPSVAVIVATAASGGVTEVIIYDADDPTLPMWMKLSARGNSAAQGPTALGWYTSGTPLLTAVTALNGIVGVVGDGGLRQVKFVSDSFRIAYTTNSYITRVNIAQREIKDVINEGNGGTGGDIIVWYESGDVDMKVFPNAPIDVSTGLPTPTIAVGTNKGLSIIKDDGTVINRSTSFINSSNPGGVRDISFDNNSGYWYTNCHYPPSTGNVESHAAVVGHSNSISTTGALASSDSQQYGELMMAIGSNDGGTTTHWSSTTLPGVWMNHGGNSANANAGYMEITPNGDFANRYGLHKFLPNYSDHSASAVAYITSDYNTGYMHGKIQLATLSDTDSANAVGASKFTNDLFTGWTTTGGNSFTVNGNGSVSVANGDGSADAMLHSPTYTLVIGKTYVIDIQTSSTSGTGLGLYLNSAGGPDGYLWNRAKTFVATQTSNTLFIYRYLGHSGTGTLNKVVLREAEVDRSIRGNGFQVFGTVPKTPVATGAELMAYGPFTASNYLQQPYNDDLDFGTGDFMYSMWIYRNSLPTSTHERWFGTVSNDGDERIDIFSNAGTDNIAFYSNDGGAVRGDVRITGVGINRWHCFHFTRQANVYKIFHNGQLKGTNTGSSTLANYQGASGNRRTHIGASEHWDANHAVLDGKIALAKVSGNVPSAEQIAKMYNEEKHLFQENAKATLYGASNAVTGLAHDDDTNTLHAGTSAGRSDFQGLRRINNTKRAITTAISAADGFIVEE